jgi:deoxyribonuclease V
MKKAEITISNKPSNYNVAAFKLEQQQKSSQVICYDAFDFIQPTLIGGTDVGFEENGSITRAAMVVLSFPKLEVMEYQVIRTPTCIPYIPGFLSFRECPALLQVWQKLKLKPDLLLVDGHGQAHPRRLGIASHLGLELNIPTIGVAKKRLCGQFSELSETAGCSVWLEDKTEQIGWVLRSKQNCNPLFISIGHRVSQETALRIVKQCLTKYRLPEPTRWADAIASNKPAFKKWLAQNNL